MRCEDIVEDNVETGEHRLAIVVTVHSYLRSEDEDSGDDAPGEEQPPLSLVKQKINCNGKTKQGSKWPTLTEIF